MVLVVEKKFLEGVWWKYGLGLFAFQMLCWFLLGFKLQVSFNILLALKNGVFIWVGWLLFSNLPFVLGRLGLRRLFWFGFIGFIVGDLAYFLLALYEPIRQLNSLLPFIGFAQMNTSFLSLGIVIELGGYVYRKVFNE